MEKAIQRGMKAIVMNEADDVATALSELQQNEQIDVGINDVVLSITLLNSIPFGHKFAIRSIQSGEEVRKYGEVIGRATTPIAIGEHVHIHNIEGIRGRGDQANKEGSR